MVSGVLNKVLENHKVWLATEGKEGRRANLRDADLQGANLQEANLRAVNLREADLQITIRKSK